MVPACFRVLQLSQGAHFWQQTHLENMSPQKSPQPVLGPASATFEAGMGTFFSLRAPLGREAGLGWAGHPEEPHRVVCCLVQGLESPP